MKWWEEYYRDVDSGDIERFSKWYADDVVARFGNSTVTRSKQELLAGLRDFFSGFSGLSHVWGPIHGSGEQAVAEGVCTYRLHDGRTISIPVATVVERSEDGLIHRSTVYFDPAPLFASTADAPGVTEPFIFVARQQPIPAAIKA